MIDEDGLLGQARALDQDTLAQIHDAYYGAIYRYISVRDDDLQTMQDLTKVFTRFLVALRKRLGQPNSIGPWSYGTASRVVRAYYRRRRRRNAVALDESIAVEQMGPAQSTEERKEKVVKRLLTAIIAAGFLLTSLWGGQEVLAEETACTAFLGAVTVDNLRVPQNASCTLDGTSVEGTIYVENGASLTAWRVSVIGNIQAEGAYLVRVLAGSTVGGSIQLKQGGAARVDQVRVNGDIQFESNQGALSATRNQVGGNIQVFQNTDGVDIVENTVDGNLQCKENNPAPTGGNNVVQGNKEDQCANLSPGDTTPPDTTILTGPSGVTENEATFTFTGSDNATPELLLLFECALDEAAFQACDSPHAVQGLTGSEHRFQVRGLDLALNADPAPATYTWTTGTWRIYLPIILRN